MKITFGIHKGKSVERLVLKEPDWIKWSLGLKDSKGSMRSLQERSRLLIARFDAKPIVRNCSQKGCKNTATCCTVYSANVNSVEWWCDGCARNQFGNSSKVQILHSYQDAIDHIDCYCKGKGSALKILIKSMSEARGLPTRVGESQAKSFFK